MDDVCGDGWRLMGEWKFEINMHETAAAEHDDEDREGKEDGRRKSSLAQKKEENE